MILITSKEIHYVAVGINIESFKLMYAFRYFAINQETGMIYESTSKSHIFYLDENLYLKHSLYYVYWNIGVDGDEYLFVSPNLPYLENKKIRCQVEIFDFKEIQFNGTYAAVYYPSLSGNYDSVSRLLMEEDVNMIPDIKKEFFRDFCLFPHETNMLGNMVLSEYKKCTNYNELKYYVRNVSFLDGIKSFRHLWIGLKTFQQHKFFHSDIKLPNIVFDGGVPKFIDFDLSFFLDGPTNPHNLFRDFNLCCIFPTVANALAIEYFFKKYNFQTPTMNDHCKKESFKYLSYYTNRFQYYGLDKLLCYNIESIQKHFDSYKFHSSQYSSFEELECVFYYISIYQLAIAFFDFIKHYETKKYKYFICKFIRYCLDFDKNGIVLIDDVILMYDEMLISIEHIISRERVNFELRSGIKLVA